MSKREGKAILHSIERRLAKRLGIADAEKFGGTPGSNPIRSALTAAFLEGYDQARAKYDPRWEKALVAADAG